MMVFRSMEPTMHCSGFCPMSRRPPNTPNSLLMPSSQRWFENLHNFSYKIILKNKKGFKLCYHREFSVFKDQRLWQKRRQIFWNSLLDSECNPSVPLNWKLPTLYFADCTAHLERAENVLTDHIPLASTSELPSQALGALVWSLVKCSARSVTKDALSWNSEDKGIFWPQ